jgi:hypothetical protein
MALKKYIMYKINTLHLITLITIVDLIINKSQGTLGLTLFVLYGLYRGLRWVILQMNKSE